MADVKLKPGWLARDMARAVARVREWTTPETPPTPTVGQKAFKEGCEGAKP